MKAGTRGRGYVKLSDAIKDIKYKTYQKIYLVGIDYENIKY